MVTSTFRSVIKEMSLNSQLKEVLDLNTNQRLNIISQKYKEIFESNLKSIKNRKARLILKNILVQFF